MPFFNNTKDVHITGDINNVEGNQNIYNIGRDKRTKRARFNLPQHIILMVRLSYR